MGVRAVRRIDGDRPRYAAEPMSPGASTAPLVVAHRGAWGPAPQNSLEAFERAIALGCDGIEIDVRRTADGRLVVVHDHRVGGRLVARQEHHRLQERMKSGQAPTLEAALELVAGRIAVDLELKEPGYVEAVMGIVGRRLTPDRYVVTSFLDGVLPEVKRHVPEARTGLLVGTRPRHRQLERRVRLADVDFLAPHITLARHGVLAWAQHHELPVWVWTVNDARALRRLAGDPRVAAVITDRPERAIAMSRAPGAG